MWQRPADPARERKRGLWDPGRSLIGSLRAYQNATNPIAKKWAVLRHMLWTAVTACDVPINTKIGTGLAAPHVLGIVIHPTAVVG